MSSQIAHHLYSHRFLEQKRNLVLKIDQINMDFFQFSIHTPDKQKIKTRIACSTSALTTLQQAFVELIQCQSFCRPELQSYSFFNVACLLSDYILHKLIDKENMLNGNETTQKQQENVGNDGKEGRNDGKEERNIQGKQERGRGNLQIHKCDQKGYLLKNKIGLLRHQQWRNSTDTRHTGKNSIKPKYRLLQAVVIKFMFF